MQPMAGTRPAREEATDTDAWTGVRPLPGHDVPGPKERTARCIGAIAARGTRHMTVLTVECFDDQVGDIRLYL